MEYRVETDSLGDVQVPVDAYYGAHTARALNNFPIGHERFPRRFLQVLGQIKMSCAEANGALGNMPVEHVDLIVRAAREVVDGLLDDHFPLVVWQTGSGTHTNMNANEVIANRANELAGSPLGSKRPIHPNDHVNRGQSTNDVFPTAMHVATALEVRDRLMPALNELRNTLQEKVVEYRDFVKLGRTHLMDAVPMTFGQELSGHVARLDASISAIESAASELHELALGGTAVGTGLNAIPGFADEAIKRLADVTFLPLRPAGNRFAIQGAHDAMVNTSASIRRLAVTLNRMAEDIRLLGSGPRAGLGELELPENEAGSSIMPGKVNPTQAEALAMVCAHVVGNDTAVTIGGMSGHLQMNVFKPLLIFNVLTSINLLGDAARSFARRCVSGMVAREDQMRRHVDHSLMLVTALAPKLGYDRAAEIAHKAHAEGSSLREAASDLGYLTEEEFDRIVRPENMVGDHGRDESE